MIAIILAILNTIIVYFVCRNYYKKYKKSYSIIIIFFILTITFYCIIANLNFVNNLKKYSETLIYDNIIILLVSMAISINLDGIIAIFLQRIYEKKIISEYEKKCEAEKYEYYRDILKNESPAILSYCYNKKINIEDEVVATLLNLKHKQIIELKDNKLTILKDINKINNHERYILNNIKKIDKKEFKYQLLKDLMEEKYVRKRDKKDVDIVSFMEIFMIWMIFYTLMTIPIFMNATSLGVFAFVAYFLTFAGVPIYKFIQSKINPVTRTRKALELSGKLVGLKKYIKDYSNIKNNGVENLNLFDDYVIYAIIFDMKGKLNDECKKIYINIKNIE